MVKVVLTKKSFNLKLIAMVIGFFLLLSFMITAVDPNRNLKAATDGKMYHSDYKSKQEVIDATLKLNDEIVSEGMVLLKNEGNALPFAAKKTGGEKKKVSVFGAGSVDPIVAAAGSAGTVKAEATIYEGLEAVGFETNQTLKTFYKDNYFTLDENGNKTVSGRQAPSFGQIATGLKMGELKTSTYTEEVVKSFDTYNDAAFIVFSRAGGEAADLPKTMVTNVNDGKKDASGNPLPARYEKIDGAVSADSHYLELDQNELDMLKGVCLSGFGKVFVIINSANPMELGFIENTDGIDAALWVGYPGLKGFSTVGKIIVGEVNPSGRLVDIYPTDFKNSPTWNNMGANITLGEDGVTPNFDGNRYLKEDGTTRDAWYLDYEENIYLGYRYYETRSITETSNANWYAENVTYPFGYGKSYTNFTWTVTETTPAKTGAITKDSTITVKVKVKNTGTVAGKEVVQLYYSAPYTAGQIEKSHVVLGAFAKTKVLAPNAEEIVTLTMKASDMASYDYTDANANQFKGYELEKGTYTLTLQKDSHNIVENGSFTYAVADDIKIEKSAKTGTDVKNRFDDVNENIENQLSRSDWTGTWPQAPTVEERKITDAEFNKLIVTVDASYDAGKPWAAATAPTQATAETRPEKAAVKFRDLNGKAYTDPLWDKLLDQLTVKEMVDLINAGGFKTIAIGYIEKPMTVDTDGPAGFTGNGTGGAKYPQFAFACVIGATWNTDLTFEMGKIIGEQGLWGKTDAEEEEDRGIYTGWYGPAMNTHRSNFAGRNAEYYSEDGYLSGKMAVSAVLGAKEKGVYSYIKHFAMYEQETNRGEIAMGGSNVKSSGLVTWCNEQAMREIYFKPFQIAIEGSDAQAVMSSFGRIGYTWAGGSYALLTEVLRQEWGFVGMVISDIAIYPYMNGDQAIRAGADLNLSAMTNTVTNTEASNTPTHLTAIRSAAKNILYTTVNSNIIDTIPASTPDETDPTPETPSCGGCGSIMTTGMGGGTTLLLTLPILAVGALVLFRKKEDDGVYKFKR